MPQLDSSILGARVAAGKTLVAVAFHVSESLDTFICWSLVGFASGLSFIITNIDTVSRHIPVNVIAHSGIIFVGMFVLAILQRYLAFLIKGAVLSAKEAENSAAAALDLPEFLKEIKKGYPWPIRLLISDPLDKILEGDLAFHGRMLIRFTSCQAILAVFYTFASIFLLWSIFANIT